MAPSVRELLRSRLTSIARKQPLEDGYKLGLAVEGGGMRGIVSGAMLVALEDLGLKGVFDGYYGTSSGSINLAYWCAEWRWGALSMYYDHLARRRFVDTRRAARGRPIVDMSLLFDDIMVRDLPLAYEAVTRSPVPLTIAVSNLDRCEAERVVLSEDPASAKEWLRAGAWLPFLAGPPTFVGAERYLDGGVFYSSPIYVAVDSGCTHVVSIGTRTTDEPPRHPGPAARLTAWRLDSLRAGAGRIYLRELKRHLDDRRALGAGETRLGDIPVFRLAVPSGGHAVSRLTTDRGVLLDGMRAGYRTVFEQLRGDEDAPSPWVFRVGPE